MMSSWVRALCAAALFLVAATASAQPRETPARWQLEGGLSGSIFKVLSGVGNEVAQNGNSGQLFVKPTWYATPVRDDGGPRSLQPFLQRTSMVYVSFSGGETSMGNDAHDAQTASFVGVSAGAEVYMRPWLVVTEVVSYRSDHRTSLTASAAIRVDDTLFQASYAFTEYGGQGDRAPRWGAIEVQVYSVLTRSLALTLSGHVQADGVGATLNLVYYATRDLGLFLGVSGDTFDSSPENRTASYAGGLSFWVSPALRFNATYQLSLTDALALPAQAPGYQATTHALTVTALVRAP